MIDAVGVLIELVTYLELVEIDALTVGMFVYRTRLDDQRRILVVFVSRCMVTLSKVGVVSP